MRESFQGGENSVFYSNDPYIVLGIKKLESIESLTKKLSVDQIRLEIDHKFDRLKTIKRKLQLRFHPDTNKDPEALEISKRINIAFEKVSKELNAVLTSLNSISGADKGKKESYKYQEKKQPTFKEMFFKELEGDFDSFNEFISYYIDSGYMQEVSKIFNLDETQKIIKLKFDKFIQESDFNDFSLVSKYFNSWRYITQIPLPNFLSNYFNSNEFFKVLNLKFNNLVHSQNILGISNYFRFLNEFKVTRLERIDLSLQNIENFCLLLMWPLPDIGKVDVVFEKLSILGFSKIKDLLKLNNIYNLILMSFDNELKGKKRTILLARYFIYFKDNDFVFPKGIHFRITTYFASSILEKK